MPKKQPTESRMKSKRVSLDAPPRQFARVGLVGKAERAQIAVWETGHLGDIGLDITENAVAVASAAN